jgi:uncharacterized membrane protein YdjX (TVP38/TMEM64 family)/rhodanese-related sulfurtransferase
MTSRGLLRILLATGIVAGAAWVAFHRHELDPQVLQGMLRHLGLFAPAAHIVLFACGTLLFVPGALFGLAGGVLFGPVWGTLLNLTGATLGATAAFLVARYIAADWVRGQAAGRMEWLINAVEREGWRFVAFTRLVPLIPFNLLNYALGLTRVPLAGYMLASCLAMLPGTLAYTWLGHAGREAASGNDAAVRYGLLGLALLATLAFLPRLLRSFKSQHTARWIEVSELVPRLDGPTAYAVIDVRGPDEFEGPLGHIAGARNVPLPELQPRMAELSALARTPIVLVCKTDMRSARAAAELEAAGLRDVFVLRGGMVRWNERRLPVARSGLASAARGDR